MRVIIQHEDIASPFLIRENAEFIPNVGDFITIVGEPNAPFIEEYKGIYEVTMRHCFFDENTGESDNVLIWVKGEIPQQPPMDKVELEKHKEQWLKHKNKR
jgi:hypothetical protein